MVDHAARGLRRSTKTFANHFKVGHAISFIGA
jgi:hypothetical protein